MFITADGARTAFRRRPGLAAFLERCAELFEVAVFTAGSQVRTPRVFPPLSGRFCMPAQKLKAVPGRDSNALELPKRAITSHAVSTPSAQYLPSICSLVR